MVIWSGLGCDPSSLPCCWARPTESSTTASIPSIPYLKTELSLSPTQATLAYVFMEATIPGSPELERNRSK